MDDNPLKRSFDLSFKEKDEQPDSSDKVDHDTAFDQSKGAAKFLNEQSNPFTEEEGEDEVPDEFKDQQNGDDDEDEEEMEEVDRGAVEDVLASLNDDYEPQGRNEDQGRGAVERVLRDLNDDNEYGINEADDELPDEMKDQQFGSDDEEEEEEEEMDEVVAAVLSELNEDEEDPCWEGYTMVGKKTDENGNEVPNCVPEEDAEDYDPNESALREDWKRRIQEDEAPCWDGYTMAGTKMQDGEEVPNCVPEDNVENYEESITHDDVLDAVLSEQTQELEALDQLAGKILND